MNATIAEFLLKHISDATDLARRSEVLAALAQLPSQRRYQLAQAVDVACRSIMAIGGTAHVRYALVQHGGRRYLEVTVRDHGGGPADEGGPPPGRAADTGPEATVATSLQRVGELVDHFETRGWPARGAVVRLAQALSPAFDLPNEAEVADWAEMLRAGSALDALALALRRARALQSSLGDVRHREQLRQQFVQPAADSETLAILSVLVNKIKNAVAMLDAAGVVTWVNQVFVQMTGYRSEDAVGHRLDELLFGPSTDPAAARRYREALQGGRELVQDVTHYRCDGRLYWVESSLIPVPDRTGRVARWVVVDTDITQRRHEEEALRAAKEAAEASNRAKSELLANLSHEIRTPMNAVIGMTELALDTQLDAEQREYLETARDSAESLLRLLNDILDLSKIEAGKLRVEEADFHPADVVAETLKMLEPKAREKGLVLESQVAADVPPWVRGDPLRVRQILFNLVDNAVKFTAQGRIVVQVECQAQQADDVELLFSVRDTGIGIPAEKLDKIFEAFSQADTSTTRRFGGSGLGLTIAAELARIMRGRIWVHSTPGQGSMFHFTVQLKLGSEPPATEPQPTGSPDISPTASAGNRAAGQVRPLRVIVADDHDANRRLVATVLAKRGHTCLEATSGRHVVELATTTPRPDVIVMDVQMPDMDGLEATRLIRQREQAEGGRVPIIALTAHAMSSDRDRCLAAGMDGYLAKPLRPSELVVAVESAAQVAVEPAAPVSTAQSEAARPMFDFEAALESMDYDQDLLVQQMQFFVNDGPQLVAQIDQAIQQDEPRALCLAAHRLKGLLARYGCGPAVQLAHQLEQLGHQGTTQAAGPLRTELGPLVDALRTAIQAYVTAHQRRRS